MLSCTRFAKVWLGVVKGALGFDLKICVGLKTLEDLDYEALHLEMTYEACSTPGGLLHLEVDVLEALLHLEVTFVG